jgi:F-type H+-transporting ATPase subunit gamma
MAGGQERILRQRIRSIQSTKKITRAFELIAASRIVKAQARVSAAVPYADGITEVVRDLRDAGAGTGHPMLEPRDETRKVATVVIAADRGLCGAYNANVLRAGEASIRDHRAAGRESTIVAVGRKAEGYFRFRNYPIESVHSGFSDNPSYEDARAVASALTRRYLDEEIDLVELVYTRFVTVGSQEVVLRPLVPLGTSDLGRPGADQAGTADAAAAGPRAGYEFEPRPEVLLDALLPRYADARMYAALLNAAASEHAARQRAMKAATDNAEELIIALTRVMNRARQDAITTEIMEIVGGAEALRAAAARTETD